MCTIVVDDAKKGASLRSISVVKVALFLAVHPFFLICQSSKNVQVLFAYSSSASKFRQLLLKPKDMTR